MNNKILISVLIAFAGYVHAATPPDNVDFQPDITYATVNNEELKLNLSKPRDAKGALPCIVVIHGGGWRAGHRNNHNDITWAAAGRGYVAVTVSYRFAPKFTFPTQVQDVKAAVRFLRGNAEKFNIDPQHIGAVGFSAGAHLSMLLGTMDKEDGLDDIGDFKDQSSKVQAVVSYFGPTDLSADYPDASKNLLRDFVGGTPKEKPEETKKASPITYVNTGDAPMLLYQGTKDILVPWDQATKMAEALTHAKVPGRVELILGANHGWTGAELQRTAAGTYAFFDQFLKGAKTP